MEFMVIGRCYMNLWPQKNRKELNQHLHDPLLYKNSFFIMLTAKLYPAEGVGIATALISSMGLLVRSRVRPWLVIDRGFLNDAFHFSAERGCAPSNPASDIRFAQSDYFAITRV